MLQPYVLPVPMQPTRVAAAAIVSLVFGILGWFGLPLIGAVVAVAAGHIALREIRMARHALGGSGLAMAGLILGYAQIIFALALLGAYLISRFTGAFGL
jgi:Domain of unknown function (DUF4190)